MQRLNSVEFGRGRTGGRQNGTLPLFPLDISSLEVAIISEARSHYWEKAVDCFDQGFDLKIKIYPTIEALVDKAERQLDVVVLSCQLRMKFAFESHRQARDIFTDSWIIIDGQQGLEKWSAFPALGNVVAILAPGVTAEVAVARLAAILCARSSHVNRETDGSRHLQAANIDDVPKEVPVPPRDPKNDPFSKASLLGLVPNLMRIRRDIFGRASEEPYLSMLLQLCYAHNAQEHVDLTALGADLRIPLSTLTRKIDYLEDLGLVRRLTNDDDRRRTFVEPTEEAVQKATAYIEAIVRSV